MLYSEEELLEKFDREKILFNKILALSERQLLLFGEVDLGDDELVKSLQALIDERETLMGSIDMIQAEIKDTVAEPDFRALVNRCRQENSAIISGIQSNDRQIMQLAKKTLGDFGKRLQEVRSNKQASKAYYGEVDTSGKGWFIDRKK